MHKAVDQESDAIVETLLDAKADVDAVNSYGETALHKAAASGYVTILVQLLNSKADPTLLSTERREIVYETPWEVTDLDPYFHDYTIVGGKSAADLAKGPEVRNIVRGILTKKEITYLRKHKVPEEDLVALSEVIKQRKEAEKKRAVAVALSVSVVSVPTSLPSSSASFNSLLSSTSK